jgi:AcrR family transcriptional regulator
VTRDHRDARDQADRRRHRVDQDECRVQVRHVHIGHLSLDNLSSANVTLMTRRRNARGEGGRLRTDLIEAAAAILAETGDEQGLSLREVTRRVGVSSPAVYLHFADRDALVAAVVTDRFARLGAAIAAAVAAAPDTPVDRLRAGCNAYVRLALDDPGTYRVLFGGRTASALDGEARERTLAPFTALVDGIAAAQAVGAVRSGDPWVLAVPVWAALHGIASLRTARPGFDWPPVDQLVDDALAGLLGLAPAQRD